MTASPWRLRELDSHGDVGKEVGRASWRWARDLGGKPEVGEDVANHPGALDSGDQARATGHTFGAGFWDRAALTSEPAGAGVTPSDCGRPYLDFPGGIWENQAHS